MYTKILRQIYLVMLLVVVLAQASNGQVAFTLPANTPLANINRIEYYLDTDPGYGSGTSIAITASTDVTVTNYSVAINTLSNGVHHLYVRSRDVNGHWSAVNNTTFFIYNLAATFPANLASYNVVKAEYFFDTDPGYGSGINIPITASNDVNTNYAASLSGLATGVHRFYVRTKNAAGNWSAVNNATFFIFNAASAFPANPAISNIVKAEYFFDTDPGYGSGSNIPIASTNDLTTTFAANITGLTNGVHRFYVRTKNATGNWSTVNNATFFIITFSSFPANPSSANVTSAEYFFDIDPGYGSGTAISFAASQDVSGTYPINITGLSNGIHRIYLRTKDAAGHWSVTNALITSIIVTTPTIPANPVPGNITKLEYFFDTDPGFGSGTTITIPATLDLANYTFTASITGLSNGAHVLYIRTYDGWSATNSKSFMIATPLPLNWLSFNATKKEETVLLEWTVANEVNNTIYQVQRSADGKAFDSVGTVKSKSTVGNNYAFVDGHPLEGVSYYRLKQVDVDGRSSYSAVLPVRFSNAGFAVYPNPASNEVNLRFKQPSTASAMLLDEKGAVVRTVSLNGQLTAKLDVQDIANGIYQLKVAEGNTVTLQKILVQH